MNHNDSKSYSEEVEITRLIFDRMKREQCLDESDRETVAYRIAEIMVTARQLYTKTLPRLTNVSGESDALMEDDLGGLQMSFLHLSDLIYEFQSTLLEALKVPLEELAPKESGEDRDESDDSEAESDDYLD